MYLVIPAIVINILAIVILSFGLFYNFEKPQIKAAFGYFVVGSLILYIIALSSVIIYKFITKPDLCCFVLLLCIISPFIIGKLVKFGTLKKYTFLQVVCYVVSLVTLFIKL